MSMLHRRVLALALPLALSLAPAAFATDIVAGPMVGHVTHNAVRVWVQVNTAERVGVRAVDVVTGRSPGSVALDVEGPAPFVADLPLAQLDPNRNYRIEVEFDGKPVDIGPPLVVRTAPPPGEIATFTLAVAGGADVGRDGKAAVPAAATLGELRPQLALMLGNLGALPEKEDDFPRTRKEAYAEIVKNHLFVRDNRDMRQIFRNVPTLAVWGERDFGPAGGGKAFVYARESMFAFRRYWPNPMYGTAEARGVYFSGSHGDIDFFALDARMQRTPAAATQPAQTSPADTAPATEPGAEMLGAGQLKWLQTELARSKATLKIVACSSPLLSVDPAVNGWAAYPKERDAFIDFVLKSPIKGVVLVSSGPYGQILCRKSGDAAGYPLYELVCPPLSAAKPGQPGEDAARLGDAFTGNGFGMLHFGGGSKAKRFVTLQIRDEKGTVKADQTVFAGNLEGQ